MKLSKREKILVILLAFFLIGVAYYQFVFIKQKTKVDELNTQKEELSTTYDNMVIQVNSMEKNKTNIKIYRDSIGSKSMLLYPQLYQDKIILEINKLLDEAKIKGSLSFSEVAVSTVEQYFIAEEGQGEEVGIPSLQGPADVINALNTEKDKNNSEESKKETSKEGVKNLLVEQMKVSLSFSGTYSNTTKFIKLVSDYARLVAVPTISLSASGEDSVSGTLDLEFYSIPKVSDEDMEYLKWTLNNPYGKANPFLEGSVLADTPGKEQSENYNIIMSVKGVNSDLPSITLGKTNDSTRSTYVYYDKNEKTDINIDVNEDNGKYYIKYKTPNSSYPENYDEKGTEVALINGKIQVAVYSSSRLSIEDKVTVNLNVASNIADKITQVTIIGDDTTSPRVNVIAKGKVEYVNK